MRRLGNRVGRIVLPLTLVLGLAALATVFMHGSIAQTQTQNPQPQQMFKQMCAECHGDDAEGDGPDHTSFIPPPANLTLVRDAPSMMLAIVRNGIQGTAMPAYPQVTQNRFSDVAAWITSRPPDTTREWTFPWSLQGQDVPPDMAPSIYLTACADCHGPTGRGDGEWAASDPHIWPKPANFHARNSEPGRLYYILTYGREGTMMAPQRDKFPEVARWALARYVYAMYDPNSTATIPTGPMQRYQNPYRPDNKSVVQEGTHTYDLYCAYCHGQAGKGSFIAPTLIDREWRYGGGTDNALFVVIDKGIPGKLMPHHKDFSAETKWSVITYIRSRGGLQNPLPTEEHEEEH